MLLSGLMITSRLTVQKKKKKKNQTNGKKKVDGISTYFHGI